MDKVTKNTFAIIARAHHKFTLAELMNVVAMIVISASIATAQH